jgi:thiosulfate reductase cytochrome b subunit
MVDATVADAAGNPVIRFRNTTPVDGEPLNAVPVTRLRPLLLMRTAPDGARRLTPVNLVSRWRWTSRGEEVPFETVRRAFFSGGATPPDLLAALDSNRDGRLSAEERRLDGEAKVEAVAARLRALGVVEPRVEGQLEPHVLAHGVPSKERALRDCQACHAADSRVATTYALAAWVPGGVPPRPPDGTKLELAGVVEAGPGGGLVFRQDAGATPTGLHVLGHSRESWSNLLGLLVFVAVALGVAGHGLVRVVLRGRRPPHPDAPPGKREYVFGRYERLWHWTMAAAGVTLMLTGLVVHFAGAAPVSLAGAVALHNGAALVLTVNASLALFYHLATAAIRNFIPSPQGLLARMLSHMEYQARGIFFGGPHPENAPGVKLNPLQQLTYLGLLNVLFPLQIGTGILIWAIGTWPALGAGLGGLAVLAPLHNLGSWLFLAFFVLHVYLVTTGRTVGDHLQSMLTGYRALDAAPGHPVSGSTGA